jgi:tRNA threonylcarbamoyladenosine biosynthesis protein TsaE
MRIIELISESVEDTLAIGRTLGEGLRAGDVVAMVGCLGAGKTHLTKGIARGLGVTDDRVVNSPTFVLINEYEGRLHVCHVDAYRLHGEAELEALGFEEMCTAGGVVLVEWADRVPTAFGPETLWIEINVSGDTQRRLTLRSDSASMPQRIAEMGLDRRHVV